MKSKKYTDNQIRWLHDWASASFKAINRAVKIVDKTSTSNNEKQNEWRGQLKDQADTFATKEQVEHLAQQMIEVQKFQSNIIGRFTVGVIVWSILLVILTWLLKTKN